MTDTSEADSPRASGWTTVRRVGPYLWPDDHPWVKRRVVIALAVLVVGRLISVITPFYYKAAVDALAGDGVSAAWMLGMGAIGLTVAYGVTRLMAVGFQQLRDVLFAPVGQRALRQLALETFTHIHRLSMRYHISRKTGGLSRIIERGVKGVEFLLRFLLFSIGPLVLELLMIGGNPRPGFRHLVPCRCRRHHRALYLVHLCGDRMAGENPQGDERPGHRRQPEGDRQSAEL